MVAADIWLPKDAKVFVTGQGLDPNGALFVSGRDGNMTALEKLSSVSFMPALSALIKTCSLCNSSTLVEHGEEWYGVGDATEVALTVLAKKAKLGT